MTPTSLRSERTSHSKPRKPCGEVVGLEHYKRMPDGSFEWMLELQAIEYGSGPEPTGMVARCKGCRRQIAVRRVD